MNETPYYYKKWRVHMNADFMFIYKRGFHDSAWSAIRAYGHFAFRGSKRLPNCLGWLIKKDEDPDLYEEAKTGALSSFLKLIG